MGRDVFEASPRAKAVYQRANAVLGFDLANLCFQGPAEKLARTDFQQPAIFVTSVAIWEAFVESGRGRGQFAFAGGLSLGEYSALHVAGALDFDDALRLVYTRGQLMQKAATAVPSAMVSLIGADERAAAALCHRAREGEVLAPANFNCPGQVVISGSKAACGRAVELAAGFDCKAVLLPVAGAFHSTLMEPAAAGLWQSLQQTELRPPRLKVISNVTADYHTESDKIRASLRSQLTMPVLWQRCVERMIVDGADRFLEVGPGRVLTGLMRKIDRRVEAVNLSTMQSLASGAEAPVRT